jgi:hypothetical protein
VGRWSAMSYEGWPTVPTPSQQDYVKLTPILRSLLVSASTIKWSSRRAGILWQCDWCNRDFVTSFKLSRYPDA